MPPQMQRFGGAPNNLSSHYQAAYPHSQAHTAGLPLPSVAANPSFMNANSMSNPFSVNGNALSLTGGFGGSGLGMPGGTGLASQAAQMSFATANLHQAHSSMGDSGSRSTGNKNRIRDVWVGNIEEEMALIRHLVDRFPYISMDLDSPGLIARPMGRFDSKADYHYQCMRCNVDFLKVIQIGLSMFTEEGETPPASMSVADLGIDTTRKEFKAYAGGVVQLPTTWQFNFKFSLKDDMYADAAIDSLSKIGLDFQRLETDGIEPSQFAALLISSGLVCDEDVRWVSFHGGYDFGYLTKLLHVLPLPNGEAEFVAVIEKFFPSLYDVKHLMRFATSRQAMGQLTPMDPRTAEILQKFEQKPSGLDPLADALKIKRQGTPHHCGSDSLLTGRIFFKIREIIFNGEISQEHVGKVNGFSQADAMLQPSNILSTPQHYNTQLQENVTPSQNGYQNGGPSTPNTGNAGLANTPGNNSNGGGMLPLTPGGAGGAFGSFQYNNK